MLSAVRAVQLATCASPLPFNDTLASCPGDPLAVAVCLSADQLQPATTPVAGPLLAPDGTPCLGCTNVTQTFYHQFFPGVTEDGALARQDETLERMSDAAGGKPVSVVEWKTVFGNEDGSGATETGAARRLAQAAGQDPIGVMGYFLIEGGDAADLQNVVSEFSGVGETIDENGRPILSQRQVRTSACLRWWPQHCVALRCGVGVCALNMHTCHDLPRAAAHMREPRRTQRRRSPPFCVLSRAFSHASIFMWIRVT